MRNAGSTDESIWVTSPYEGEERKVIGACTNALCGLDRSRERTLCVAMPACGDEKIIGDVAASGSAAEFAAPGG